MSSASSQLELDVLVVGAGFGGLSQLHQLRKLGHKVKVFEAGSQIGGIWYWNCYPGARVDSPIPIYELSLEELWRDWNWTERFPGWQELRAYFRHVDEKLDLSKDIFFNTRVTNAKWDTSMSRWIIQSDGGAPVVHARFLVLAVGFAAKHYMPAFEGLDTYQGICHHTAKWPQQGVDLKGKKVAVIGTGASGVQVIQELGSEGACKHLTVFQRTPNIAVPMRQRKIDVAQQNQEKELYPILYRRRLQTPGGFVWERFPKTYFSMTPEERLLRLESGYATGTFEFLTSICSDLATDEKANAEVYAFWRKKTLARINDPKLQEKLAPVTPPHPMVARRHSLEQTYYEVFNQSNVDLVDTNETPIARFTNKGIVTSDGVEREFDAVVLATGFDSITGGIIQIDIRGVDGSSIKDKWKNGVYTYLGMAIENFPNMFYICGPQAPTALANGPTCVEVQGNWIIECIEHMTKNNLSSIEPTSEAAQYWRNMVFSVWDATLLKKSRSWWNGANIPGKIIEPLNFSGGLGYYAQICEEKAKNGYEGFHIVR
ncbi:hypothetical protein VNI00_003552 [Paramarasmius palmivorus]|uniref:FAD/NAD(P)-binding domain-containing protein n=1 Tax=Paramarasmius palmivorus TaxID=297713 RepID=A0AAW0DS00_9AGAR